VALCVGNQIVNKKLDIKQLFKDIGSKGNLRGLANAMGVAAIVGAPAAPVGNLDLNGIALNLHNKIVEEAVQGVAAVAQGEKAGKVIKKGVINVGVNAAGACAAHWVGDLHGKGDLNFVGKKAALFIIGAAQAAALDSKNLKGALFAGAAAVGAEALAEVIQETKVMDRNVAADIAKVFVVTAAVAAGQDHVIADRVARNALDNNNKKHPGKDDKGKEELDEEDEDGKGTKKSELEDLWDDITKPPSPRLTRAIIEHGLQVLGDVLEPIHEHVLKPVLEFQAGINNGLKQIHAIQNVVHEAVGIRAIPNLQEAAGDALNVLAKGNEQIKANLRRGCRDNGINAAVCQDVVDVMGVGGVALNGLSKFMRAKNLVGAVNVAKVEKAVARKQQYSVEGLDLARLKHMPAKVAGEKQFLHHDKIAVVGGKAMPVGQFAGMKPVVAPNAGGGRAHQAPAPRANNNAPKSHYEGAPPQKTAPPAVQQTKPAPAPIAKPAVTKQRPDMGEYRDTKGHHVHAKKAFEGHVNYNSQKGFSISNEFMNRNNIDHIVVTSEQRRLFTELAKSGRKNTIMEHSRIAVEALVKGNCPREIARKLVAESLKKLKNSGVREPVNIPWKK